MAWKLESDRPIYAQLVEIIERQIVSGTYQPGSRLPSVRDLASEASVNPNTMQKAFSELERSGLIITQRTNGRIVTEDSNMINQIRDNLAQQNLVLFIASMKELGYTDEQIVQMVSKNIEEDNHESSFRM